MTKASNAGAVRLRQHAELTEVGPDEVVVTVAAGPHDEAVVLWSSRPGRDALRGRTTSTSGVSLPDSVVPGGVAARVVSHSPEVRSVVSIPDLALAHCHVQPLPGDRMLVVGCRCRKP